MQDRESFLENISTYTFPFIAFLSHSLQNYEDYEPVTNFVFGKILFFDTNYSFDSRLDSLAVTVSTKGLQISGCKILSLQICQYDSLLLLNIYAMNETCLKWENQLSL